VTADRFQFGAVLCVRDKDMKQAWCLATNLTDATASSLKRLYGKRWGIEIGFRGTKDRATAWDWARSASAWRGGPTFVAVECARQCVAHIAWGRWRGTRL